MIKRTLQISLVVLFIFSGCASAGPVVSNVSYDGDGKLSIEKCKIHANYFLGTMELEECNHHEIKIR